MAGEVDEIRDQLQGVVEAALVHIGLIPWRVIGGARLRSGSGLPTRHITPSQLERQA